MKLLASLLIAVSLALGCYSAAKAYVRDVATIDAGERLTLNAPAGADQAGAPLLAPKPDADVVLDEEVLALLRDRGVRYVRVKEFRLLRWNLNWLFALSALGLLAGAIIIRRENARILAGVTRGAHARAASPQQLLDDAARDVAQLSESLASRAGQPHDRLGLIIDGIDAIQKSHLMPFVEARPIIIGRHGMAGYAQIMDRFAAAERELNRAWSAAADGVEDEAIQCVQTAAARFEETRAKLAELDG